MSWNYRIFKQATPQAADGEDLFFIGECYYKKSGKPELHSTMEHNLLGATDLKELRDTYQRISEAFKAPVIELTETGEFTEPGLRII